LKMWVQAFQVAVVVAAGVGVWALVWRRKTGCASGHDGASLSPTEFRPFSVLRVKELTHNTRLVEFSGNVRDVIGPGMHLSVREPEGGKTRPYSPTQCGPDSFFIAVKRYEGGAVSRYVHSVRVGDSVQMKGPVGSFDLRKVAAGAWLFVAAGSGVTPIFSVLRHEVEGAGLKHKIVLLLSNSTVDDVMLREELRELEALGRGMLVIRHVISRRDGRLNGAVIRETIEQHIAPETVAFVGLCGPLAFCDVMTAALNEPEVAALCKVRTDTRQNDSFWRF
jgi:cytochrome-b5 reductase